MISCVISVVPFKHLVTPKSLISIESFDGIDEVTIGGTFTGSGKCMILVTNDLTTYKTFKDGAWKSVDHTDLTVVEADGLNQATIAGVTRDFWDEMTLRKAGIGFAYLPVIATITDMCKVDWIQLKVDMRGSWDKAVHGTDYVYGYPRNNILRVTLKTNGDYKINYSEGAKALGDPA